MTAKLFSGLSIEEKLAHLWKCGHYLDAIDYQRFKAYLYAVDSFYVEVLYYQGSNQLEKVDIATEESLNKFLNKINLNTLHSA